MYQIMALGINPSLESGVRGYTCTENIVVSTGEQISDLELYFCGLHFPLDLAVCVINDCQEHVKEDKENNEDVEDKKEWTKVLFSTLKCRKIKVS